MAICPMGHIRGPADFPHGDAWGSRNPRTFHIRAKNRSMDQVVTCPYVGKPFRELKPSLPVTKGLRLTRPWCAYMPEGVINGFTTRGRSNGEAGD
jgi:hypothetical protein